MNYMELMTLRNNIAPSGYGDRDILNYIKQHNKLVYLDFFSDCKAKGITESLINENLILWIRKMNAFSESARENKELIYEKAFMVSTKTFDRKIGFCSSK